MISEKQKVLDGKKWADSVIAGKDMCGHYEYCCACNKQEENPCENAIKRYKKMNKKVRAKAKAKLNFEGKEVVFRSTILEK